MLLRCLKIINATINPLNPKTMGSAAFPKSQALRGNANAATMEPNETKRKTKKIEIKTITAINVPTGIWRSQQQEPTAPLIHPQHRTIRGKESHPTTTTE